MNDIFVDTSALYAWINKNDKFHRIVVDFIKTTSSHLVTTNIVFASFSTKTKRY